MRTQLSESSSLILLHHVDVVQMRQSTERIHRYQNIPRHFPIDPGEFGILGPDVGPDYNVYRSYTIIEYYKTRRDCSVFVRLERERERRKGEEREKENEKEKRNVFQCRPKAEVVMKVVKTQKQKAVQCSHPPPYPTTPPVNSYILGPRQMLMWHPTFGRVGGECRLRAENVDYVYGWI